MGRGARRGDHVSRRLGHWQHYLNDTVNYTEALFVVVIMALASTRPIINFAESSLRRVATISAAARRRPGGSRSSSSVRCSGRSSPSRRDDDLRAAARAPVLRSRAKRAAEVRDAGPAVRQRLDRRHADALRRAADAHGGAAVGMGHGVHARAASAGARSLAIGVSTLAYCLLFRKELAALAERPPAADVERPDEEAAGPTLLPVPPWVVAAHLAFMAWTVAVLPLPGALPRRVPVLPRLRARDGRLSEPCRVEDAAARRVLPRAVSSSTAGSRAGGSRRCCDSLSETPLFLGATLLTAFNDNALITYLATLVPDLDDPLKLAIVEGAVIGGGLTVIANAPNPAGQALLGRFFGGAVCRSGWPRARSCPRSSARWCSDSKRSGHWNIGSSGHLIGPIEQSMTQ